MALPFLGDELWVLITARLDVRSLGRLACVCRRFNAKVVAVDPDQNHARDGSGRTAAAPTELLSVVVAGARRACAACSAHVTSCSPRLPEQPLLRLLWERTLLSHAATLTAVSSGRTEFSEAGAVAFQPRMPLAEQRDVWASSESEPAHALVPAEDNSMHTATCVVLECSHLLVGAVPLRAGRHYVELELTQNSLVPDSGALPPMGSTPPLSTSRFGVINGPLAWSGVAPHALWSPVAKLNPRSKWAQFTDARGRNYFVREQNTDEIAEHDSAHFVQVDADDTGGALQETGGCSAAAVAVDPIFAPQERVMDALLYEAVASVSVPPEGVSVKLKDKDTDDYYFDSIPGQQWFFDAVDGDLIGCDNVRSKWEGQRGAKEKDSIGLLLDIEVGTLDVYLNGSRLGRMACGLKGVGPFRFAAEIFTEAKVRIVSKPPPPPYLPTPPTAV